MSKPITPHGGKLIHRIINKKETNDFFSIEINNDLANDVGNIADGIFSPLEGFLCRQDLDNVIHFGKLTTDKSWTMPIILDVDEVTANKMKDAGDVLLKNFINNAIMQVEEIYHFDKKTIMENVYGTIDPAHPGVKKINNMKNTFVGGKITCIQKPIEDKTRVYRKTPIETRNMFKQLNWNTIVAFQTRNPPHVAHEMMQKTALIHHDGLFINPLIGKKKTGDFTDNIIIKSYELLIKKYYVSRRCELVTLHTDMKYAGPKEAIHHAILRQNYGCTHIIIGRDHAGVGNYYKPFAAQEIFSEYTDLEIKPLFFPAFFYCTACLSFTHNKACPHDINTREQISGTKLRNIIQTNQKPSKFILRPEISEIILNDPNPFVN